MIKGTFFNPLVFKSRLALVLCFTLVFSLISTMTADPTDAKSVRIAIIEKLTGSVTVKKAGGSKSFRAFTNMSLNQGDHVITGAKSSVILKVVDHEDEVTIGENSSIYLSKLNDKGSSKKTAVKMWAGSIWVKAKTLVNSDDEFEIETPTAVMAVRGTQFFTGVDSETGETKVVVAAGKVKAKVNLPTQEDNLPESKSPVQDTTVTILPSQQINLNSNNEGPDEVSIINLDSFIENASEEIIKAIVRNKKESDEENADFIKEQQKKLDNNDTASEDGSTLEIKDQAALDRITKNLDNLIGNIVKTAIDNNKVDKDQINKIIEDVNKQSEKKLDLDKVLELDLSSKEKAKQDELALLEKMKQQKLEERKKLEAEKLKKFEELLKQIEEAKKKADIANKLAQELAKKAAEDLYKTKLNADALAQFNSNKEALVTPSPTPTPTPLPTSNPPAPTPAPRVAMVVTNSIFPGNINVDVQVYNVKELFAAEVHLLYDDRLTNEGIPIHSLFVPTDSPDYVDNYREDTAAVQVDGRTARELTYVITKSQSTASTLTSNSDGSFLKFSLWNTSNSDITDGTMQLIYIKLVKRDGSIIYVTPNSPPAPVKYNVSTTPGLSIPT